jgi:hypothetical protein
LVLRSVQILGVCDSPTVTKLSVSLCVFRAPLNNLATLLYVGSIP